MASESDDGTAEFMQVVVAQYHGGGQYRPVFLDDDWMVRMMELALGLLREPDLSEMVVTGLFAVTCNLTAGSRPAVCRVALEGGLVDLVASNTRSLGMENALVCGVRSHGTRLGVALCSAVSLTKAFAGGAVRPDLEACLSSGLIELCHEMLDTFAARGVDGLSDTNGMAVASGLTVLRNCKDVPGCEENIRRQAKALTFCLEHSLDIAAGAGLTSGSNAAGLCVAVFGRDEGGSEFTFTQKHVDELLIHGSNSIRGVGAGAFARPSADNMKVLELCISDQNKPLLLANPTLIPYLISALFLDPDHPRADLNDDVKAWNQKMHCECLAQLAVFPAGREALRQDPAVRPALEEVAARGMSAEAREFAEGALMALSDKELVALAEVSPQAASRLRVISEAVSDRWLVITGRAEAYHAQLSMGRAICDPACE